MLNKLKNRKQEGFTIIEVLIVLAIAGLILLVVFLAVPALNRNAHNNQYKTEANNLLGAYQEVSNNNGGSPLTPTATSAADTNSMKNAANLKSLSGTIRIIAATTAAQTPAIGNATIVEGSTCTAQNSNVPAAGTSRQIALFYQIESANSAAVYQCISE